MTFGPFEIGPGLGDLALEKIARIGRRFVATFEVGANEAIGDAIDDLCRQNG